jgi:hypothetical protein
MATTKKLRREKVGVCGKARENREEEKEGGPAPSRAAGEREKMIAFILDRSPAKSHIECQVNQSLARGFGLTNAP